MGERCKTERRVASLYLRLRLVELLLSILATMLGIVATLLTIWQVT